MKNLTLNKINFAGATELTREELKKVMGGVISPETALKMCAEDLARVVASEENPDVAQVIYEIGAEGCLDAYEGMIRPHTLPGNYN